MRRGGREGMEERWRGGEGRGMRRGGGEGKGRGGEEIK